VQVVGYRARVDDHAELLFAADRGVTVESLSPGTELAYTLGERRCAGAIESDTRPAEGETLVHHACGSADAPYCPEHTSRWPCARCTGDCDKPVDACDEEHAVYLAAFAPDTAKAGVTRSWRLDTRLREQGADRAAHLRTVADGRIARQVEADIAADIGDRVRVPTKIAGFADSVDDQFWAALCAEYDPLEQFDFGPGLREMPCGDQSGEATTGDDDVHTRALGGTDKPVSVSSQPGAAIAATRLTAPTPGTTPGDAREPNRGIISLGA